MSWQQYVQAATGLGFTRVCIIARANYQTVGTTDQKDDIAKAYLDNEKQINENQELLDDWNNKAKTTFRFFQMKFNILIRDEDDSYVVCARNSGKEVLVARQFKTIWFVAYGKAKPKNADKKDAGFNGAQGAIHSISTNIWDKLAEANV